jgi:hypothetical protein
MSTAESILKNSMRQATRNVQLMSIAVAVTFALRLTTVTAMILKQTSILLVYEIGTVLYLACLVYLLLFLSRRGEAGHSEDLTRV